MTDMFEDGFGDGFGGDEEYGEYGFGDEYGAGAGLAKTTKEISGDN